MEYQSQFYEKFLEEISKIAAAYSLNPDNLEVEFYAPGSQAIFIETVENHRFKIHINLQEHRIISYQMMTGTQNGEAESIKDKYRKYMK